MTRRRHGRVCLLLALAALPCLAGCERGDARAPRAPDDGFDARSVGYPSGPWWRDDIDDVIVSVAHILVTHRDSQVQDSVLQRVAPAHDRTAADALALAQQIADAAHAQPGRFADFARQYSEDPATRPLGGRIGTVHAMQLPVAMVDALGNLAPGQTSRVVQSALGYHVLQRLAVAPEETVAGLEIQVHHRDSHTFTAPGRSRARTREQAAALAAKIAAEAHREPERFAELVARHSDTWSRLGGGEATWSTYEPYDEPPDLTAISALSSLELGAVSPVIEDRSGFRIWRRIAPAEQQYAVSMFMVGHASGELPVPPDITRTRAEAKQLAASVFAAVQAAPQQFDALRARHCDYQLCRASALARPAARYAEGGLSRLLGETAIGEIVPELVEAPGGFLIVRREDERRFARPKAAHRFELPRPAPETLATASEAQLTWFAGQFEARALPTLALSDAKKTRLAELLRAGFARIAVAPARDRPELLAVMFHEVELEAGAEHAGSLRRRMDELVVQLQGVTVAQAARRGVRAR